MAKVNDLQCIGDALFQSDVKVNGKLNNEVLDVDNNCLIIDVCRRLDLSAVGNEIEIDLPDGYCCNATALGSVAALNIDTYGASGTWTANPQVQVSCISFQDDSIVASSAVSIQKNSYGSLGFIPFAKTYIKVEVTTAAVGTETYAAISGKIYCKKIS